MAHVSEEGAEEGGTPVLDGIGSPVIDDIGSPMIDGIGSPLIHGPSPPHNCIGMLVFLHQHAGVMFNNENAGR